MTIENFQEGKSSKRETLRKKIVIVTLQIEPNRINLMFKKIAN